ncbi:hypothetical protein GCM10023085_35300 [Actinomadura viridis]
MLAADRSPASVTTAAAAPTSATSAGERVVAIRHPLPVTPGEINVTVRSAAARQAPLTGGGTGRGTAIGSAGSQVRRSL